MVKACALRGFRALCGRGLKGKFVVVAPKFRRVLGFVCLFLIRILVFFCSSEKKLGCRNLGEGKLFEAFLDIQERG